MPEEFARLIKVLFSWFGYLPLVAKFMLFSGILFIATSFSIGSAVYRLLGFRFCASVYRGTTFFVSG